MKTQVSEHGEQAALIEWARANEQAVPELKMLFAIPNGGHRYKATAIKMRAEGVKRGVPDLFLAVPRLERGAGGLFIEMKVGRNKCSAEQIELIDALRKNGYCVVVCYGFEQARDAIETYLGINTNAALPFSDKPLRARRAADRERIADGYDVG